MIRSGALWLPYSELYRARETLSMPNRAHEQALKMRERGKRMPLPPEMIDPVYEGTDAIAVPRRCPIEGVGAEDRRVRPPADRHARAVEPRPYQSKALRAWADAGGEGVVTAPCGAGKTVIGMSAIVRCPTPALVLVHTGDLVAQWAAVAARWGVPTEVCAEGSGLKVGRLVIATIQGVSRLPFDAVAEWGRHFGLVVTDEAHHVPADTWSRTLYALPGRWRLGLTATPDREDGLTPLLHWHNGPTVFEIDHRDLVEAGVVIAPRVVRIDTGWEPQAEDWGEMLTEATESDARNATLLDAVRRLVAGGRHVMVQTERTAHAEAVATVLAEEGIPAAALHGKVPEKKRAERLAGAASGAIRVITATQLGDEGLDLPILDALVLGVPQRNPGRLEQRVGRVSRARPGKHDAIVVDLVDGGMLSRLWWARRRVYQKLGCDVGAL